MWLKFDEICLTNKPEILNKLAKLKKKTKLGLKKTYIAFILHRFAAIAR